MVWYVLLKVVCWNGYPFHSTHATSHALQPMQVVTSTSLQTPSPSVRLAPLPGDGPACPEIALTSSASVGMASSYWAKRRQETGVRRQNPGDLLRFEILTPDSCLLSPVFQAFSSFTRNPLNSGVYALGSIAAGDSAFAKVRAVLPASSAMPR